MLWKCCTQYASKLVKLSSDHRTGKGPFLFQFQRKTMPKNVVLISHASKVMLKILQTRLQQYMNWELTDVRFRKGFSGFRKGRGTRDQSASIRWITGKAREFQNIHFCFIDCTKTFHCVDHNKLWKFLEEMGISDHLTCLLRSLYAGQEETEKKHGTMDWFQIGGGVHQGCILSPCLFNLYTEYIMRNIRLDEAQAGIRLPGETSITSDMQVTPPLWRKVKSN